MQKKVTVTVGIPAFNEEKNISKAIKSVLSQDQVNYQIKKIIIVSDGSTDKTVNKVLSFNDKRVLLLSSSQRLGKAKRLNQIFNLTSGQYLVLMDADTYLRKDSIQMLIEKFTHNQNIVLVGGNPTPANVGNFWEKVINSGVRIARYVRITMRGGKNVYAVHGCFLALKTQFAKKIKLPPVMGTDAYLYFYAQNLKKLQAYSEDAIAYYYLPNVLSDHLKQSARFIESKKEMIDIFGEKVRGEYKIPQSLMLRILISEFLKNHIYFITYLFIFLLAFIKSKTSKSEIRKGVWSISLSTKELN